MGRTRGGRRHHHRRAGRSRRGGNAVSTAAVPFGLFALSNYLSGRKHRRGTRKGMRRKTARRAYMKKM